MSVQKKSMAAEISECTLQVKLSWYYNYTAIIQNNLGSVKYKNSVKYVKKAKLKSSVKFQNSIKFSCL